MKTDAKRIVIVGGGAGGLELAVRLGKARGTEVLLIDAGKTHVWKPRLHELAAGMNRGDVDEVGYAALADYWGFAFEQGELLAIDADAHTIGLAAIKDGEGNVRVPKRAIEYRVLVLALGGVTPDLGVDGVLEHAVLLDRAADAEALAYRFSEGLLARSRVNSDAPFRIVIVGSGLTGVELAGHLATNAFSAALAPRSAAPAVEITIVEATDTFMPGMDESVREATRERLGHAGVAIKTGQQVSRVSADRIEIDGGPSLGADLTVWATGRVGPPLVERIGRLSHNKKRQWRVKKTLQSIDSEHVFALGDCAVIDEDPAPPTAEAASEQAEHLASELPRYLNGQQPDAFAFQDKGTLLSLGTAGSVGRIRGVFGLDIEVRGRLSRAAYRGLERQHQMILLGAAKGFQDAAADVLGRATGPHLKVH